MRARRSELTLAARPWLGPSVLACGLALFVAVCATPAAAAPIPATVTGCVGETCTVEPTGGPVALDPAGFTLEADWEPDCIRLLANSEGEWLVRLRFEFTGVHDGTENFGTLTLLDQSGLPIAALNEQFDDTNVVGNIIPAVYEIFGTPDTDFIVQGLTLTLSDGSGVDTLNWVSATFYPSEEAACPVPEPSVVLLLGAALAGARLWRRDRA